MLNQTQSMLVFYDFYSLIFHFVVIKVKIVKFYKSNNYFKRNNIIFLHFISLLIIFKVQQENYIEKIKNY